MNGIDSIDGIDDTGSNDIIMATATNICGADNDHEDDSRSVNTDEAFMDMLGLSLQDMEGESGGMTMMVEEEGEATTIEIGIDVNINTNINISTDMEDERKASSSESSPIVYNDINLPPRCSRHLIPPSSCFAIVIDNVLTESQCQYLIQKAHSNTGPSSSSNSNSSPRSSPNSTSGNGFQYITEATHRAPDGTSYTVQIQNPNPHKLAVIDTDHGGDIDSNDITNGNANDNDNDNGKNRSNIKKYQGATEATKIMDELYTKISKVLNESSSSSSTLSSSTSSFSYQKFVSRKKCSNHRGLNPRMRILKYDAIHNDKFDAHFDATTFVQCKKKYKQPHQHQIQQQRRHRSLITVLVYLNNGGGIDFSGGETVYLDYHNSLSTRTRNTNTNTTMTKTTNDANGNNSVKITPKVGRVVLFEHDLFHSGSMLDWGTKYIMRTDVLFDEQQEQDVHQHQHEVNDDEKRKDGNRMLDGKNIVQKEWGKGEEMGMNTNDDGDDDHNNDDDDQVAATEPLLSNICDEMDLPSKYVLILNEMDLLHISLYAFLSPGITLLKTMLIDAGIEEDVVQKLVQRAIVLTTTQK